ncbi:MAG: hypothetical protein K0S78_4470, partial [Thermomicrobiales bacterium]|nr:hypothetical protein [Thermomicrobiales bacterium]
MLLTHEMFFALAVLAWASINGELEATMN